MNKKMNGILVSDILYKELNKYLETKDQIPKIVDISIGEDFGNKMYSKMKKKTITSKNPIKYIKKQIDKKTYIKQQNNN